MVRGKDAGSVQMRHLDATDDAASRRPACPCGSGFHCVRGCKPRHEARLPRCASRRSATGPDRSTGWWSCSELQRSRRSSMSGDSPAHDIIPSSTSPPRRVARGGRDQLPALARAGGRLAGEPGEDRFGCIRVAAFRSYAARMTTPDCSQRSRRNSPSRLLPSCAQDALAALPPT